MFWWPLCHWEPPSPPQARPAVGLSWNMLGQALARPLSSPALFLRLRQVASQELVPACPALCQQMRAKLLRISASPPLFGCSRSTPSPAEGPRVTWECLGQEQEGGRGWATPMFHLLWLTCEKELPSGKRSQAEEACCVFSFHYLLAQDTVANFSFVTVNLEFPVLNKKC